MFLKLKNHQLAMLTLLFLTIFESQSQTIQTVYDADNNYIGTLMGNWEHYNDIQIYFDDGYYTYASPFTGEIDSFLIYYESTDCTGQGYSPYFTLGRVFLTGDNINQNSYRIFRGSWDSIPTEKTFNSRLVNNGQCLEQGATEINYTLVEEVSLNDYNIYFNLPDSVGYKGPLKLKPVNVPIFCSGFESCPAVVQ